MRIKFKKTKTVSIGDEVELNGVLVQVTEDLVKALPELFTSCKYRVTTIDGVDIYNGDEYWCVASQDLSFGAYSTIMDAITDILPSVIRFSTKEAAEAYIKSKKVLFVTEDGVSVMKGDTVFLCPSRDNTSWLPHQRHIYMHCKNAEFRSGWMYFSTPKARDQWAKENTKLFTTEDGVDVYDTDKYYIVVNGKLSEIETANCGTGGAKAYNSGKLRFSSGVKAIEYIKKNIENTFLEAVEAYIKKNSEKTLADYEKMLLPHPQQRLGLSVERMLNDIFGDGGMYVALKLHEPKLYYLKVLQLIADDLNGDWKPDWNDANENKYVIVSNKSRIEHNVFTYFNGGLHAFKHSDMRGKALKIMGDKIHLIFD